MAATKFGLTWFSRLPPPTEKISRGSALPSRLARSQPSKIPAQPSSLVRAVSSPTLSVGAYASSPQILRKSLTACDALAALPPTPRMKSRPPPARQAASVAARRSTAATSICLRISAASARNCSVNVMIDEQHESRTRHQRGAFEIEAHAHFAQSSFAQRVAQASLVLGVQHQEAAPAGADQFAAHRSVGARQLVVLVDGGTCHGFRPVLLALPVLVHDGGKAEQIALLERGLALITELLDLVQVLDHPVVATAGLDRKSVV